MPAGSSFGLTGRVEMLSWCWTCVFVDCFLTPTPQVTACLECDREEILGNILYLLANSGSVSLLDRSTAKLVVSE